MWSGGTACQVPAPDGLGDSLATGPCYEASTAKSCSAFAAAPLGAEAELQRCAAYCCRFLAGARGYRNKPETTITRPSAATRLRRGDTTAHWADCNVPVREVLRLFAPGCCGRPASGSSCSCSPWRGAPSPLGPSPTEPAVAVAQKGAMVCLLLQRCLAAGFAAIAFPRPGSLERKTQTRAFRPCNEANAAAVSL